MDSMREDKLAEGQIASLQQQFSDLAREVGISPSDPAPPTSMKTSRLSLATSHRLADWRVVVLLGSLLVAPIGVAAWRSSSADTAMMAPSDPKPLAQAAPEAAAPKTSHRSLLACLPGWRSSSNRWRAISLP